MAAHIGLEALNVMVDESFIERSHDLGLHLMQALKKINSPLIKDIRGRGLFIGLEIDPAKASGREVCMALLKNGLLSKETHDTVIRLAPPLVISKKELDQAISIVAKTLAEFG